VANVGGVPIFPRPIRALLRPLGVSAEGMATQQRFLEVIAANIANAETTRTPAGGPYERQVATLTTDPATGQPTLRVTTDAQPGRQLYQPGHPDADVNGFVTYPNVDINAELVDLMIVRRVHEANASVFQAAKSMLRRALEI
jgi:flagellar basal-body rod protein FlgC